MIPLNTLDGYACWQGCKAPAIQRFQWRKSAHHLVLAGRSAFWHSAYILRESYPCRYTPFPQGRTSRDMARIPASGLMCDHLPAIAGILWWGSPANLE